MRPPAWDQFRGGAGFLPSLLQADSRMDRGRAQIATAARPQPGPARSCPAFRHEPGAGLTAARPPDPQAAVHNVHSTLAQHIGDCRTAPVSVPTTRPGPCERPGNTSKSRCRNAQSARNLLPVTPPEPSPPSAVLWNHCGHTEHRAHTDPSRAALWNHCAHTEYTQTPQTPHEPRNHCGHTEHTHRPVTARPARPGSSRGARSA